MKSLNSWYRALALAALFGCGRASPELTLQRGVMQAVGTTAGAGAAASPTGAAGESPAALAGTTGGAAGHADAGAALPESRGAGGTSGTFAPGGSAATMGGAGATSGDAGSLAAEAPTKKSRRAVSADFLNKTLSVIDIDKLTEGASRQDALIGTVDLSMYSPGPLAVAVTPDGKTALASISGGWLGLVTSGIPPGDGTLVFVDLATLTVQGELFTGASPMGIAITPDGKHAFVGQLSDTYMSYVDIEQRSYQPISTGNQWNEELAIDDSGTIGVLTTGTAGDSMGFSVMDPMTHGQTVGLSGDAGGVAFFPGTKFAFVVQAPTTLTGNTGGYNVLDLSDPTSPQVTDNQRVIGDTRQAYPVTAVPSRRSVVYPVADNGKLSLIEMTLDAGTAKMVQSIAVGDSQFSYGLTATPDAKVLACAGGEHFVAVVDLDTAESFTVPWGTTDVGPLDIALIP